MFGDVFVRERASDRVCIFILYMLIRLCVGFFLSMFRFSIRKFQLGTLSHRHTHFNWGADNRYTDSNKNITLNATKRDALVTHCVHVFVWCWFWLCFFAESTQLLVFVCVCILFGIWKRTRNIHYAKWMKQKNGIDFNKQKIAAQLIKCSQTI